MGWQNQKPLRTKEAEITHPDDPGSLLTSPLHLLRRALQNYTAHWQETIPGVTAPQHAILRAVRDLPGADQSRISSVTSIDVATLTVALTRLEQRGFITRQVDPDNKRRKLLYLTDEGSDLVDRTTELASAVDDVVLAELSPEKVDGLIDALRYIAFRPSQPKAPAGGGTGTDGDG